MPVPTVAACRGAHPAVRNSRIALFLDGSSWRGLQEVAIAGHAILGSVLSSQTHVLEKSEFETPNFVSKPLVSMD